MENCVSSNKEKRGAPRVQQLFMTSYQQKENGPSRTPVSLGRTVDISPYGVGMEIYNELAVGTAMEIVIDLAAPPVSAMGKIVRVDPLANGNYLIGIKFDAEQELLQTRIKLAEISALQQQRDELEKVLTTLVHTGWPWGEAGEPKELLPTDKAGFAAAIHKAKELIGQLQPSKITAN